MNNSSDSPVCERGSDLVTFLYEEAGQTETPDFKLHLQNCRQCQVELDAFSGVRESITAWRDEALLGFEAAPATAPARKKSAVLALRQFFDLSPLWLKGAAAFAAVALCAVVGLLVLKVNREPSPGKPEADSNLVYTEQDVRRLVQEALASQESTSKPVENVPVKADPNPRQRRIRNPKQNSKPVANNDQFADSRRPLSKAERERLATDLRLLSPEDELGLQLLGDRINQE